MKRKSKDKILNSRGRKFIDLIGSIKGYILNGITKGDEKDEFTYVDPRGCSVFDYVIENENCIEIVSNFKIGERIDSDYMPLLLKLENGSSREENEEKKEEDGMEDEEERRVRICWNLKTKQEYKKRTDDMREEFKWEDKPIEEIWKKPEMDNTWGNG